MFELIAIGVGVLALGGMITGAAVHFEAQGQERTERKYAPMVALCPDVGKLLGGTRKADPPECAAHMQKGNEALEVNAGLKRDVDRIEGERKACSREVDRLKAIGEKARAKAKERKPDDDKKTDTATVEMEELIAALPAIDAMALSGKLSCEQRLARRDALWAKVAKEQERDFPRTAAPAKSTSDVTIKAPAK